MPYPYSIKTLRTLPTHDGQALTATLYRGKLKVGTIEDTGTGGGTWAHFASRAEQDLFSAWVKSLGEVHRPAGNGTPAFSYAHTEDSALGLLITEAQDAKEAAQLNRAAKTNLLYRQAEDGEHAYRKMTLPEQTRDLPLAAVIAVYRVKAPWFAAVTGVWVPGNGWTPPDQV